MNLEPDAAVAATWTILFLPAGATSWIKGKWKSKLTGLYENLASLSPADYVCLSLLILTLCTHDPP